VDGAWKWLVRPCLPAGRLSRTCVMPVMTGIRVMTGWVGVALNAPDARALAYFYRDLFGRPLAADEPDWCHHARPGGACQPCISGRVLYERPMWPATTGKQQIMMHLDIDVTDLDAAVHDAIPLGAELHVHQPQADVRVMLDPAGHPCCLYVDTGD
jgi:hypothetical protein